MSSKRQIMIVLGVLLAVTLACGPDDGALPNSPTRTRAPEGPTKVPATSLYYTTTTGTFKVSEWY